MSSNFESIRELNEKLDFLLKKQAAFSEEIQEIQQVIFQINARENLKEEPTLAEPEIKKIISEHKPSYSSISTTTKVNPVSSETQSSKFVSQPKNISKPSSVNSNLEKFIGENLINKIGIAITIIGVSIGAKYSIDHDLISPLTRILLGYLVGLSLLGIGIKLKSHYENYSAVLVSGAMAIMYFITFLAYSLYNLFPQLPAFLLMVLFTVFTVFAAIKYKLQVIAHIGLVGAYAVPFLLSKDSGNVTVLYSYMAIINIGILVISFLKYWKPLHYSSFILTWLIFLTSFRLGIQANGRIDATLIFLTVFFLIFYTGFLAYKLRKNEQFLLEDIFLLLANSFLFYGIGYSILNDHETAKDFLGAFTVGNALIHSFVGYIIYRQRLADKNMFYLVSGLVLVFLIIAIPVQLDGNWVTLLWAGEAALLFWIGKTKNNPVYEILSYPLLLITAISIFQDWGTGPYIVMPKVEITPLLNINFLSSVLVTCSFGFITFLNLSPKKETTSRSLRDFRKLFDIIIPASFLILLYFTFRMEIESYFQQQYADSTIRIGNGAEYMPTIITNSYLLQFKSIWINIYTMLFLSTLTVINIRKFKNKILGWVFLSLNTIAIAVFLIEDLYILGELREAYLDQLFVDNYPKGIIYIGIRYICFVFVAALLVSTYQTIKQKFTDLELKMEFDLFLSLTILWISSSELINWLDIAGSAQSYKLGLSIFWGIFALLVIAMGIWKQKKYLRVAAISLFGITLIKLFLYDISDLDTISKTIVFVSLGVLLLIISFLYNKYRQIIFE